MNGHLVTIEIGIKALTDERVQLDSLTFDKYWLEGLNRQTVERWSAVKKYILILDDFINSIPHGRFAEFNHSRSTANVVGVFALNKPADNERLKGFERHHLRQTTLINLEFWTSHDNRTT